LEGGRAIAQRITTGAFDHFFSDLLQTPRLRLLYTLCDGDRTLEKDRGRLTDGLEAAVLTLALLHHQRVIVLAGVKEVYSPASATALVVTLQWCHCIVIMYQK
jgi:hypothetical protein